MSQSAVTVENGWALYAHSLFIKRLLELDAEVERLVEADPTGFHHHPTYKFYDAVLRNTKQTVPLNPNHSSFRQGGTLGRRFKHWFRVKNHSLPPRYRLFYQFRSEAPKTIIYAWLNDESCIRNAGSKNDVYAVFRQMLEAGKMPNSFEDLLAQSGVLPP